MTEWIHIYIEDSVTNLPHPCQGAAAELSATKPSLLRRIVHKKHRYLNNSIFIAKFSETAKFIYKLAKFVFSEHIVVFYKVFFHNIFPLD